MQTTFKDFVIRDWAVSDRTAAAEVVKTVLAEYGLAWEASCGGCSDRDVVEVEKFYWQNGGEFWVIEQAGKLVGTGAYYPIARSANPRGKGAVEIRKMYLLPEARGYGLGRYLLAQLEVAAAANGFTEIVVETATVLTEAVALYEKNGYEPISEVETERCDKAYLKLIG
ncbi:MAG: GNAT family N-acetyltransferase [Cyanobacteria bacterium P01_F01_bin.53]